MLDALNPVLLAVLSALCIAVARTLYREALIWLTPMVTTLTTLLVATLCACFFYFLSGGMERWPLEGVLWFVLIGLVAGLAGRYLSFMSIHLVGLARTSVVMQTSLVWSSALGFLVLGERLTLAVGAGTLGIMMGAILLVHDPDKRGKKVPFRYYLVPALSAMTFGVSPLLQKFGMASLPSAPLGMAISSATALLCMATIFPFSKEGAPPSWDRRALLTVSMGGVFNAGSALFFWSAVKGGEMVQVIPISRLSVPMIIFSSWLFFRKQESVTLRVVVGGGLAVAGAFAVVWGK